MARRKYSSPLDANINSVYHSYMESGITKDQFFELSQKNCFYCGAPPSNKCNNYQRRKNTSQEVKDGYAFIYNGLDRIDSSKPHTIDNVVSCCHACNTAKMHHSQEIFKQNIQDIYNFWAKSYLENKGK